MPNVIGESYTVVGKKQLVKLGFSVAKLKNQQPRNQVNAQDEPGQQINPDKATVTLLVSKGPSSRRVVPNLKRHNKVKDIVGYSLKALKIILVRTINTKVEEEDQMIIRMMVPVLRQLPNRVLT